MARRTERLFWRLALLVSVCLLAGSAPAASSDSASFTVPIVISSGGLAGSFYTSELSLTNRGTTAATVRFTYSAAFGGGGGSATDSLPAGRQKTVPDAIQYLISIGTPIPSSGNRGGVLRVDFAGLSSADAGAATARTTTAVPGGRAGLSYPAFGDGIGGAAYLCGLRQDATDRSNVALLNAGSAGAGDIVLRLTASSGDPGAPVSRVLPDLTLAPGAFTQYTEILKGVGLDRGYVRVDRISGRAPYYAYATILDQTTSDGSFVPPLAEDAAYGTAGLTLPVVVETSAFSTEVVLTNVSATAQTVRLSYVADAVQATDSTAAVSIALAAGEQKVIPAFVQYLRNQGVPGVGAPGPAFAGALHLTGSEETGGIFLGGRTQTTGGGGRYGLFYTAVSHGTAATSAAWLYGLQQNAENRTNLALVNTGESDTSTVGLHVDLYDGETGSIAKSFDVPLAPRKWAQFNSVLSDAGIANGYARVSRTSGTNPFLAYAVVVDGGQPQTRSDDGAFVAFQVEEPPPSAELLAIRKVEEKSRSLRAQGLSRLDYVRAVAAYMATLPDYAATGADEVSLTAYGAFRNGRLHMVTDNREFDAIPQGLARGTRRSLATTELPGSGWARLMQSFGEMSFTQEPVFDLAAPLENPGGYAIRAGKVGDARLTALRAVSGDGFFYFNTHGGRAWKTSDESGPSFFALYSSTPVTPTADLQGEIKADLDAGRLTYFQASTFRTRFNPETGQDEEVHETHYGITGDFVKAYWHFAPDSIVFLNACFSAYTKDPAGPQDFIDACWSAGAGVYFGWNWKANSGTCFTTVRYFVDRLIGANKFMKESPNQRAFPWELVYDDMKKRGLTHDNVTGADLVPFPRAGGNSVLLDPSIEELIVNEFDETLKLKGYFGSKQGKVTAGNGALVIRSWAPDTIVCALPATGPGSNGDVTVEVPGELGRTRKSNVHQLTEWNIPLHYLWTDAYGLGGLKFEGNGKLRFRADVGSFRQKPGAPPVFPLRGMVPTKDSSLPLTGSGSHSDGSCTTTLSGSGVFPSATNGAPLALLLVAPAKVDANTPHLGGLGLAFGAAQGALPFKFTLSGPGCSGSNPVAPAFGLLDGPIDFPSPEEGQPALPLPGLLLTWDGQFRIPAKKFTDGSFGGALTIEWQQAVEPNPPPNFDVAR